MALAALPLTTRLWASRRSGLSFMVSNRRCASSSWSKRINPLTSATCGSDEVESRRCARWKASLAKSRFFSSSFANPSCMANQNRAEFKASAHFLVPLTRIATLNRSSASANRSCFKRTTPNPPNASGFLGSLRNSDSNRFSAASTLPPFSALKASRNATERASSGWGWDT